MPRIAPPKTVALLALILALFFFAPGIALYAQGAEKGVLGEVEDIILLPWQVKIPARIDTGAALSSLDVCELSVKRKVVEFTLPERCGGAKHSLPLLAWKRVKSAAGTERRPMVALEICVAGRKITTQVTLTDRSKLEYPFLLGRNTLLDGKFIVDVGIRQTSMPDCPEPATP